LFGDHTETVMLIQTRHELLVTDELCVV